jgi:hypothetical protein
VPVEPGPVAVDDGTVVGFAALVGGCKRVVAPVVVGRVAGEGEGARGVVDVGGVSGADGTPVAAGGAGRGGAGDDIEPAWDRPFRRTYSFISGFRPADTGFQLYNYGSLDGGVGEIWNVRRAYYASGGMRYARALPEIYNETMARAWAGLSRLILERFGAPLSFAGVMTQHHRCCRGCGFSAREAHRALVREPAKHLRTLIRELTGGDEHRLGATARRGSLAFNLSQALQL